MKRRLDDKRLALRSEERRYFIKQIVLVRDFVYDIEQKREINVVVRHTDFVRLAFVQGDAARIGQEMPELLSVQGGVRTRPSLIEYGVEKVGEVEGEEPSNFVVPGYLVMFVFMAAAFSAEAIVRERQNHTLERLLAACR